MREQIVRDGLSFLSKVLLELENRGVRLERHWDIDHLCYRTATLDRYLELKDEFETFADLLIESEVNGRPISTFRLRDPWQTAERTIELLELPAPKPGKVTVEGFEHLEIVCDLTMAELKDRLRDHALDESGLKKDWNQELELELSGCAVKFHHLSLASVVALEGNKKIWSAIESSRVLKILKPYRPLLAGTFPLGLGVEGSDVDLLMTAEDLAAIKRELALQFANAPDFQVRLETVKGVPSLIAHFTFAGVPFEIFAQAKESVRQDAYRHFQVEERLLKLGGAALRERLRALRAKGLKTEPAFAEALGLSGDPYSRLLELAQASDVELRRSLASLAQGQ
jgi:predicted metalloenzyme YecM